MLKFHGPHRSAAHKVLGNPCTEIRGGARHKNQGPRRSHTMTGAPRRKATYTGRKGVSLEID